MKTCPNCRQIYQDTDDAFCANDGALLVTEPGAGQVASREMPTQVVSRPLPSPYPKPVRDQTDSSPWLYLIIGVLATALAGFGGYVLFQGNAAETAVKSQAAASPSSQSASPSPSPSVTPAPDKGFVSSANVNRPAVNTVANGPVSNPFSTVQTPTGTWRGDWSSPSGAYLSQVVTLRDEGNGVIGGQIEWTLRRTTRPEKMSKIGFSATEYVSGHFDPATQTVTLQGYRKDDPNEVLVLLDAYRLRLSGNTLSGYARNGGKWNGRMSLSK